MNSFIYFKEQNKTFMDSLKYFHFKNLGAILQIIFVKNIPLLLCWFSLLHSVILTLVFCIVRSGGHTIFCGFMLFMPDILNSLKSRLLSSFLIESSYL